MLWTNFWQNFIYFRNKIHQITFNCQSLECLSAEVLNLKRKCDKIGNILQRIEAYCKIWLMCWNSNQRGLSKTNLYFFRELNFLISQLRTKMTQNRSRDKPDLMLSMFNVASNNLNKIHPLTSRQLYGKNLRHSLSCYHHYWFVGWYHTFQNSMFNDLLLIQW